MELAYRLAVDDAPYIKYIRSHMIVLITPVVEVDGRDRMVDIYKWHKAHPDQKWPHLLYWGHYVAHDNNRDAMGMTLNLTRNVLDTYLDWHAQVLHDLHESVPFLYDNTVGDGPYNAWVDPQLADEWAELGWNNVAQMQSFGMPGVFTHGDFDTWSPGYLMFLAAMHNGISRLYETFGNGGADTEKRILDPEEYSRTWYRQNPPLPIVNWSQRDNNNYEQTRAAVDDLLLLAAHASFPRELLRQEQARDPEADARRSGGLCDSARCCARESRGRVAEGPEAPACRDTATLRRRHLHSARREARRQTEAGDVRRRQPCGAHGSALLAHRRCTARSPVLGAGRSAEASLRRHRLVVRASLQCEGRARSRCGDPEGRHDSRWMIRPRSPENSTATGSLVAVNNTGQISLLALVYKLKGAKIEAAEKPFDADGKHFAAGSLLISGAAGRSRRKRTPRSRARWHAACRSAAGARRMR